MGPCLKTLGFLIMTIVITACVRQSFLSQPEEKPVSIAAPYNDVLGKSITDDVVIDFVGSQQCSSILPYILCKEAGIALMLSANEDVEGVFLYVNKSTGFVPFEDDFTPYKGELPYGLKYYDTMGAVEYKLSRQDVGNYGLPDSGSTPDHIHYVAFYKEAGLTIIYNSPQDEDALIHAILIQK